MQQAQAQLPQVAQSSLTTGPRPIADVNDPAMSETSTNSRSNQVNNMAAHAGPSTGRPNLTLVQEVTLQNFNSVFLG